MNEQTLIETYNKTTFTAAEVVSLINASQDSLMKEQAVKQAVIHDKLNNEARFVDIEGVKYLHEDFVKSIFNQLG
jgi:hypothetical protein